MNIITIFNYPKDSVEYTNMCAIWLQQVNKHKGECNVKILTEGTLNPTLMGLINEYDFTLVIGGRFDMSNDKDIKAYHNVGFKLHNLCKETEPFIFIDADAFVITDLAHLIKACNGQRYVAINHECVPGHTAQFQYKFLNSGVQICNDPSILDFKTIITCQKISPGTDQSLLFSYFNLMGYDYTNPNVGFEWNSYSKYVTIEKDGDGWIGTSNGLDYTHPVCINHYWLADSKPWSLKCPIYNEFLNEK